MRRLRKLVFPLLLLSIIVGCSEDEVVEDNNQTKGNLSIQLTDAPFPSDLVSEANVTINKIEIRKSNENDGNPFTILSEEEKTFNLLELTNGITATLAEIEVDTGAYNLIRLYVADANIVTNDSTTYNLKVPGGSASGIKIFIDPSVVVTSDTTSQVLLDFDVSQSFVVQGNPDTPAGIKGFIFKPTIKASNLAVSGQLKGMVTDSTDTAIQGAQVAVYTADTLHTSTLSNDAGNYTLAGLNAGNYDITVEYNDYTPVTIEDIEVIAGESVTQDVQLTETE